MKKQKRAGKVNSKVENRGSVLTLDLQFFSESEKAKKKYWYDLFIEEVNESKFKEETLALVEEIEGFAKKHTPELMEELIQKVEKALIPETFKERLFRRIRIFETRLSREVPESFGPMLKYLREEKGYTLRELHRRSGVTASYIQRLETGKKTSPGKGVIRSLSEALDADILGLLEQSEFKSDKKVGLSEIIVSSSFNVSDHEASEREKELLVAIYDIVSNGQFKDFRIAQENTIKLTNKIIEFQELANKQED